MYPDEDDDEVEAPGPVEMPDRPGDYDDITNLPPHPGVDDMYGKRRGKRTRFKRRMNHKRL